MLNLEWLSNEAHRLHAIFQTAFFSVLAVFIILAVVLEFLKVPIGEAPGFMTLVGRALIATVLLIAMPEIMNTVSDITDSIAREIGSLNEFHNVLSRMGERLQSLTWSWISVKDIVILIMSFLSFFVLYVTVYLADAAFLYCWTLIYILSPLVLALFVFPQTAGATKAMFRSMIEISLWKVVWATMAALLWSTALSDINQPEHQINFLTAMVLNLMLAVSILMTPFLVKGLLSGGPANVATSLQGLMLAGISMTPAGLIAKPMQLSKFVANKARSIPRSQNTSKIRHPREYLEK